MDKKQAKNISDLLIEYSSLSNTNYRFVEIKKDEILNEFHPWANGKKQIGTFLINGTKQTYWLSIINWNERPDEYHLVVFPKNRSKPILEAHKIDNYSIFWKYSPSKHDGKNNERKEYFKSKYGSLEIKITYPAKLEGIDAFLNDIFKVTEIRIESDKSVFTNINDKMNNIIEEYIDFCKETNDWNEGYKWQTVSHFQKNWDIEAGDFGKMFKEAINKRSNLIYSKSSATLIAAAKEYPDTVKKIINYIFNEEVDLNKRYDYFYKEYKELSNKLEISSNNTVTPPREAEFAFLLTCNNPQKHYFYNSRFYVKFAKHIEEKPKKAGEKYSHYKELMDNFRTKYVMTNIEVASLSSQKLPDNEKLIENKTILTQSIIFVVFEIIRTNVGEKELIEAIETMELENASNFFNLIDIFIANLSIKKNDQRIHYNYSTSDKSLTITIGKRYCLYYNLNNEKPFGFILPKHISTTPQIEREDYKDKPDASFCRSKKCNYLLSIFDRIVEASEIELQRTTKSAYRKLTNLAFEKSIFDLEYRNEIFNNIFEQYPLQNCLEYDINKKETMKQNLPLNQILFGPPGTGKTYHTINEAVKIVEELSDDAFDEKYGNDRKKLKEAFKNYLEEAEPHIAFTTFHQSFSYEDFIEGIKPVMKNKTANTTIIKKTDNIEDANDLEYEIQDGIFKRISQSADAWDKRDEKNDANEMIFAEKEINEAIFYKMSLGNSQFEDDEEVYKYCIENNKIALAWGGDINYEKINDENEIRKMAKSVGIGDIPARTISYFKLNLKKGNYIVISKGNTRIRAIAKVTGEYYYNENSPIEYNHFRDVEWLIKDKNIPVKDFYEKQFMQHTLYKLKNKFVNSAFFKTDEGKTEEKDKKIIRRNHVLIIDEINRGNVSQIFGELITLIEKDKRKGENEELSATLPYSKVKFSVPPNLYIIGTMNTADRSIEALDTALRRRFTFKEMPPKSDIIAKEGNLKNTNGVLNKIDLVKMLDTINKRIEKLIDKDHEIGHSYLMNVETIEELRLSFKDKIIPLLEEYFYGDFGKIGLVLGNDFIKEHNNKDDFYFAEFKGYDADVIDDFKQRKVYEFTNWKNWNAECFINIYTQIKN